MSQLSPCLRFDDSLIVRSIRTTVFPFPHCLDGVSKWMDTTGTLGGRKTSCNVPFAVSSPHPLKRTTRTESSIPSCSCSRHKLPKMIHENSFALESLGLFRVLAQDSIVMTVFCKIAVFCFIFDEVEACKMTIPILHCQAFGLHYAFR